LAGQSATGSSLDVGLVSLAMVVPLITGALLGGSLADAVDHRTILLITTRFDGSSTAMEVIAGAGVRFVYWMDVATMATAVAATFLMGPQVPQVSPGAAATGPACARSRLVSASCAAGRSYRALT
jgi:hypothetical protein